MLKFFLVFLGLLIMSLFGEFMLFIFYLSFISLFWILSYTYFLSSGSFLGVDFISWFLVLLTYWIISLMFMASHSYKIMNFYYEKFSFIICLMMMVLYFTFCTYNTLGFYIFFEGSLIPIYILIVGWGYQPERLQAGIYLLLYTVFASLPLLISIMYLSNLTGGYSFFYTILMYKTGYMMNIWFFFSIFAFLVKLPVFYFHLWLPKAHVEAPVSGSMMLAGVLLKLGCYGLMRMMMFFNGMISYISSLLVSIGLMGGMLVSFICLRQVDLKSLIAYSSVSHMGLALGGLGSWGMWGYSSCLYTCVAHGLCSSGMFFLSGVIYDRSGSRSIMINKGMISVMPNISFWWFLMCVGNMAAPIVLNLVGELGLLGSILSFSFYSLMILMIFSFMGAAYSLYLFSSVQHGGYNLGLKSLMDGSVRENLVLLLHFFPLFFLILEVDMMSL
uniref:NADH dehydrogenase subunit 4 n=1 Tax=Smilium sinense TaxID=1380519 RepID=UPI0021CCB03A|nr:NADH dehydrogenase subunit 4 [Smilium sinense]UWM12992.1 NADH dehydrogenase subunit 4 [Smilium sinense]